MTARNHHYLPQCYLKMFALHKKGKWTLHVSDLKDGRPFRTTIRNVGARRDFNRVDLAGHDQNVIEIDISRFEDILGPAIKRTCKHATFVSDDDRTAVLNLVGMLATRNPRLRSEVLRFRSDTAMLIAEILLKDKRRFEAAVSDAKVAGEMPEDTKATAEDLIKLVRNKKFQLFPNQNTQVGLEMEAFSSLLPAIFDRNWCIMSACSNSMFVCSDHPLTLTWTTKKLEHGFYGPGLGMMNTQVLLPLSSKIALLGMFEPLPRLWELDKKQVAAANGVTISQSERQVYSRDELFLYSSSATELMRSGKDLTNDLNHRRHVYP